MVHQILLMDSHKDSPDIALLWVIQVWHSQLIIQILKCLDNKCHLILLLMANLWDSLWDNQWDNNTLCSHLMEHPMSILDHHLFIIASILSSQLSYFINLITSVPCRCSKLVCCIRN